MGKKSRLKQERKKTESDPMRSFYKAQGFMLDSKPADIHKTFLEILDNAAWDV